jgi:hypothetical protein
MIESASKQQFTCDVKIWWLGVAVCLGLYHATSSEAHFETLKNNCWYLLSERPSEKSSTETRGVGERGFDDNDIN